MAHHQDRRLALPQFLFEPFAGGNVEVVVGLIQQQHVRARREQQVEHESLAFASGEFRNEPR